MTPNFPLIPPQMLQVPGNISGDLEQWLRSLRKEDIEDVFDMFYIDGAVQRLIAVAVTLYENEMDSDMPEDVDFRLELLSRLMVAVQQEAMLRIGLVRKETGRRKIYTKDQVKMTLVPR